MALALFIFPHYDDEFGVFETLRAHSESEDRVLVVFLTSSAEPNHRATMRAFFTRFILSRLGINADSILKLGENSGTADLDLVNNLEDLFETLTKIVNEHEDLRFLYTPAFEGGHPDHDGAFVLGAAIAKVFEERNVKAFQFPMYTSSGRNFPFFSLFSPLEMNGDVRELKLRRSDSWRFFLFFFLYIFVQPKTVLGLMLSFFYKVVIQKRYYLQEVSYHRIFQRPHAGTLLYEKRSMGNYDEFLNKVETFVNGIYQTELVDANEAP